MKATPGRSDRPEKDLQISGPNLLHREALLARISRALADDDIDRVTQELAALRPPDRVDIFEYFGLDQQRYLIAEMDDAEAAAILDELSDEDAAGVAVALAPKTLAPIVDRMATDEAGDLIGDLPKDQAEKILSEMDDSAEAYVRALLGYADDTAGGRMVLDFIALQVGETVAESIDRLRAESPSQDATYYLYVVDDEGRLVGIVSLRQLVVAQAEWRLDQLMSGDVIAIPAEADQESAARLMARYDLLALPVLDAEHRLIGVITHDDLVDVLEEEATEDMYRLVGLQQQEQRADSLVFSVRKRLPWLALNLGMQLTLVFALMGFETTLNKLAALAILFPLVTGQGGNVGAQAMTFIVRSMALGEIDRDNRMKVLGREVALGLVNGLAIGVMAGLIALLVMGDHQEALLVAIVMFSAMALNLTAGGLIGVLVPLTLRRYGFDPAVASSVFVTTMTDTLGVILFLGLYGLVS